MDGSLGSSQAGASAALASWIAGPHSPSGPARVWARHALLDWAAVTIAGTLEPLSEILADEARIDAPGEASLLGRKLRVAGSWAVLVNGATGHALDYDDVNERMIGHPGVVVFPPLIALAEEHDFNILQILDAAILGYQVAAAVGGATGPGHYALGYHVTGTIGSFAAVAAAAALLRLDAQQTLMALGIAASQAAGLKAMFGTMTKPLQAGHAAQVGWMAARLARRGYTSAPDSLEATQGFWATHFGNRQADVALALDAQREAITETLFKHHAACYLTHASIDAVRLLVEGGLRPDEVEAIHLLVPTQILGSCNIADPVTDLECKFSLRHAAAMALSGIDTADPASYLPESKGGPKLSGIRNQVTVVGLDLPQTDLMRATVRARLRDGRVLEAPGDAGRPASDLARQWYALRDKAEALIDPILGSQSSAAIAAHIEDGSGSVRTFLETCR